MKTNGYPEGVSGIGRDTADQCIIGSRPERNHMDKEHKEVTEQSCCCGTRHKKRTEEEQKALLARLRRIEGQIRGLERMVENDAYCPDILVQSSAATSALNSFNKVLLGCHIRSCVAEDIRSGKDETVDELCELLQRLMK